MKKPIQLSIANPCHENWDNMTPADKSRFCASCQKNVRDFTHASDREILEALKNGSQACGRFRASQLNRNLVTPKEKSRFWAAASAAAITLLTVGVNEAVAQAPVVIEQQNGQSENEDKKVETDTLKMINGAVVDSQGMPIPSVSVKVAGKPGEVRTDFDGNFSIEAKEGDKLEFIYLGMIPQEIIISELIQLKIVLQDDPRLLEDIIVGCYSSGDWPRGVAREFMFGY